jgi:hypothetical protein
MCGYRLRWGSRVMVRRLMLRGMSSMVGRLSVMLRWRQRWIVRAVLWRRR